MTDTIHTIQQAEHDATQLLEQAQRDHTHVLEKAQQEQADELKRYEHELDTEQKAHQADIKQEIESIWDTETQNGSKDISSIKEIAEKNTPKAVQYVLRSIRNNNI